MLLVSKHNDAYENCTYRSNFSMLLSIIWVDVARVLFSTKSFIFEKINFNLSITDCHVSVRDSKITIMQDSFLGFKFLKRIYIYRSSLDQMALSQAHLHFS